MQLDLSHANRVADLLRQHRHTVAVVESSAGGFIAASLLALPGASRYFLGGAVVYTQQARSALVNITDEDMKGMRSSSEPYAALLANKIRDLHGATWGLAETGAAGPTGNRYGDAAGHTCIAIAGPNDTSTNTSGQHVSTLETGNDNREQNMLAFTTQALVKFETLLQNIT